MKKIHHQSRPMIDSLRELLALVECTEGPSAQLDEAIHLLLFNITKPEEGAPAPFTVFRDFAKELVKYQLPGFWFSTTTCWRTADADIGPDFTGPHGEDLLAAGWSQEEHDGAVFQAVVSPGEPAHAECLALIAATLKALITKETLVPPSPEVLAERCAALATMKAQAEANRARDQHASREDGASEVGHE